MYLTRIDVSDIALNGNVRVELGDTSSLEASIEKHGLMHPVIVAETDDESGTYVLVSGHRRLAAVKALKWTVMDVFITDTLKNASDVIAHQYAENVERKDLSAFEEAQVAWDLKLEGNKQTEVAELMGVERKKVAEYHKVYKAMSSPDLDPHRATQLGAAAILKIAQEVETEDVPDVVRLIVDGEVKSVRDAVWVNKQDHLNAELADELAQLQHEWAELGITVTDTNPSSKGLSKSGSMMTDTNVKEVKWLGIELADHMSLPCQVVWLQPSYGNRPPIPTYWCNDVRSHLPKGDVKPDVVAPAAVKEEAAKVEASAVRKASRVAKLERIAQAEQWMNIKDTAGDRELMALNLATQNFREEHDRMAVKMLGFEKERPKGEPWGWHSARLEAYLDDRFGDNTLKRDRWKVRFLTAYGFIDQRYGGDNTYWSQLQDIEVTDGD
jgi:ParB family chromosome partitioning protein